MLDLLTNVKYLLKLEQVCIDNNVFRLHYKATAFLLAICSIIITSKQYIGDPIDCVLDSNINQEAINTYCWIFSTFTIANKQNENHLQRHQGPYPGVGNEYEASEIVHQKYYQWVCFILAIQAAMFIFPHCLWRVWEGGRIKMLVADLSFITVVGFLYDVFLFRKPCVRVYVLQAQARFVSRTHIRTIVSKGTLGHWFLLHQLGRNMNPFVFGDLLTDLSKILEQSKSRSKEFKDNSTAV